MKQSPFVERITSQSSTYQEISSFWSGAFLFNMYTLLVNSRERKCGIRGQFSSIHVISFAKTIKGRRQRCSEIRCWRSTVSVRRTRFITMIKRPRQRCLGIRFWRSTVSGRRTYFITTMKRPRQRCTEIRCWGSTISGRRTTSIAILIAHTQKKTQGDKKLGFSCHGIAVQFR